MTATTLRRQFIRDAGGIPIGVILPIEEYVRVASLLDERLIDDQTKRDLSKLSMQSEILCFWPTCARRWPFMKWLMLSDLHVMRVVSLDQTRESELEKIG